MPAYEYKCDCGNSVVLTRFTEERDSPVYCGQCERVMHRIYTSPGITFRGTGFYTTDKRK